MSFTFQLEGMSVDVNYTELPNYEDFIMDAVVNGDATIKLAMSVSDVSGVFMFATDSSDITDADAADIQYTTNSALWNNADGSNTPLDVFGDDDKRSGVNTCENGENTGHSTHMNGAGEYVRHLASDITGGYGSSDIFSNEVALLDAVKALKTQVDTQITQQIDNANNLNNSTTTDINLTRTLLTQLLTGGYNPSDNVDFSNTTLADGVAAGRNRIYARLKARDPSGTGISGDQLGAMSIPFEADDEIHFNITVKGAFSADGGAGSNTNHGLGSNAVSDRKYRVEIKLTA